MMPAWVPCPHCDGYWCLLHGMHAHDCPCPPVEEWDESPYGSAMNDHDAPPSDLAEVRYRELGFMGFPGYRVGDDGSIWTCREREYLRGEGRRGVRYVLGGDWIRMKTRASPSGYVEVQLSRNGKQVHRLVHRLALLAFVGPPPPGCETFHEDNDRGNNRLLNLRWGTKKENQQHRRRCERERGHVDVRRRSRPSPGSP